MISALFLGIVGGFILSIPPGPLSIAVTKQSIEGHFRNAVLLVGGAAVMDVVYTLVAAFASSAIVVTVTSLIMDNEWILLSFQIIAVGILVFLGIRYLTSEYCAKATEQSQLREAAQEAKAKQMGRSSPFFLGVLIALTNLASPTFLPSMIAFIAYLHARHWLHTGPGSSIVFSVAFGMGTMIWFTVVIHLLTRFRKKLSAGFITGVYKFAGATFLLFAGILVYNIVTATEWHQLL